MLEKELENVIQIKRALRRKEKAEKRLGKKLEALKLVTSLEKVKEIFFGAEYDRIMSDKGTDAERKVVAEKQQKVIKELTEMDELLKRKSAVLRNQRGIHHKLDLMKERGVKVFVGAAHSNHKALDRLKWILLGKTEADILALYDNQDLQTKLYTVDVDQFLAKTKQKSKGGALTAEQVQELNLLVAWFDASQIEKIVGWKLDMRQVIMCMWNMVEFYGILNFFCRIA